MRLVKLTAAVILLAAMHPRAVAPVGGRQRAGHVQWSEPSDSWGESARCSLEFSARNGPDQCRYSIRYAGRYGLGNGALESIAAQRESAITHDPSAAVELMIPIRVANSVRPEILVSRSRSDWGDYRLYGVRDDTVMELWGIVHRDPACVRWVASRGALDHFVVYDRWRPEPAWPRPTRRPGDRWQLRQVYRFNAKAGAWQIATQNWEEYEFGKPLDNPVLDSPADCTFLYHRPTGTVNAWRCGLQGASLRGAGLIGADLTWTRLDGADLTNAKLTGARYSRHTCWPGGSDPRRRSVPRP